MEPLVYSVDRVAELLGISRGAAYQAVRDGSIPAVRVGRLWLIERETFHTWLKGDRPPATDGDPKTTAEPRRARTRSTGSATEVAALPSNRPSREAAA